MGIYQAVSDELARSDRASPSGSTGAPLRFQAQSAGQVPSPQSVKPSPSNKADDVVTSALSRIAHYFPSEIMGIYLFGLSLEGSVSAAYPWFTGATVYGVCLAITPLTGLLMAWSLSKSASSKSDWRRWPWWALISSTIAFATWGAAVPGNSILPGVPGNLLMSFLALVMAFLLDTVGRAL